MPDPHDLTLDKLELARRAIASGRDATVIPDGYANFDLALSIVRGCRDGIDMADAHDPHTIIPKLEMATEALELFQSGAAELSIKAARAHIDEAIAALRSFAAPE